MKSLQRVLIVAGGTGGHVFPGLAVAQALIAQGVKVQWLGTPTGIEAKVIPAANIPITYIKIRGLRGMGWQRLLRAPLDLTHTVYTAWKLLREYKPDVVIGMGGFAAGPAGIACLLSGVPLVIHEQNSIGGFTNRVLAHFAKKVLLGLPQAQHPNALKSNLITGNPIRADLLQITPPLQRFQQREGEFHLLIVGGSLGALALNKLIPQALAKLSIENIVGKKITVWHQTGARNMQSAEEAYAALPASLKEKITVQLFPFIEDMAAAYQWADLVICRAGALTISELAAVGVPALLIPFPAAIDEHQTYNAQYLVEKGGALLLPQGNLTPETLAQQIQQLAANRQKLQQMAVAAHKAYYPQSTEIIINEVKSCII